MGLRKAFCPQCGEETNINDAREFCFCVNCGFKIPTIKKNISLINSNIVSEGEASFSNSKLDIKSIVSNDLETKLQEATFYFSLSKERQEPHKALQENPYYYLKAQDLLLELSKSFHGDYRVWWELSKPIDFDCVFDCVDILNQYHINEEYFDRALNCAALEKKKELIQLRDQYERNKLSTENELEQRRREIENEKQQLLMLEQEKKRQLELERIAEEEARNKAQRDKEKELQLKKEKQQNMQIVENAAVWDKLVHKEFSIITETYFNLTLADGQKIVVVFRAISNILYLLSFRLDEVRGVFYKDQSLPIQFDNQGHVLKYDNKPVYIRGASQVASELKIHGDGHGNLYVNQIELIRDKAYVNKIMQSAKKQLLSFNKILF